MIMVFPLGSYEKRTRLVKIVKLLEARGFDLSAWVWQRDDTDTASARVKRKVLLSGGGYMPRRSSVWYVRWVLVVFWSALWKRKTSGPLYCLGFESAFPVWMASFINRSLVFVFDDADRFSMLNKFPAPVVALLRYLERKVSEGSLVHIVPTLERYEFRNAKQLVLFNMPSEKTISAARSASIHGQMLETLQGKRLIYVSGRLVGHRGLGVALELAEKFESRDDVAFVCCGYTHGDAAEKFVSKLNVHYFGEVSQEISLAWAAQCDWTFTLYDPSIEINKYALANKWGDCLVVGSVPIVNDEVITAEFLRGARACISAEYGSAESVYKSIVEQLDSPSLLDEMKSNLKKLATNYVSFENGFEDVIVKLESSVDV